MAGERNRLAGEGVEDDLLEGAFASAVPRASGPGGLFRQIPPQNRRNQSLARRDGNSRSWLIVDIPDRGSLKPRSQADATDQFIPQPGGGPHKRNISKAGPKSALALESRHLHGLGWMVNKLPQRVYIHS